MRDGGRVLLAVLNMYVRIKIRVVTFDISHSATDSMQSVAASIQKLPDSVVKSVSTARRSPCVRRNYQVIDQFVVSR
jgi:hypothetical protein